MLGPDGCFGFWLLEVGLLGVAVERNVSFLHAEGGKDTMGQSRVIGELDFVLILARSNRLMRTPDRIAVFHVKDDTGIPESCSSLGETQNFRFEDFGGNCVRRDSFRVDAESQLIRTGLDFEAKHPLRVTGRGHLVVDGDFGSFDPCHSAGFHLGGAHT